MVLKMAPKIRLPLDNLTNGVTQRTKIWVTDEIRDFVEEVTQILGENFNAYATPINRGYDDPFFEKGH